MNLDPAQWASVVASLGSSAAAVVVVVCFVGYLRDRDKAEFEMLKDKGRVIEANTAALVAFSLVFSQHKELVDRAMSEISEVRTWCDRCVPDFIAYTRTRDRRHKADAPKEETRPR